MLDNALIYNNYEKDAAYYFVLASANERLGNNIEALAAYKNYMNITDSLDLKIFDADTKFIEERHRKEIELIDAEHSKESITLISIIAILCAVIIIYLIRKQLQIRTAEKKQLEIEKKRYEQLYADAIAERDALTKMIEDSSVKDKLFHMEFVNDLDAVTEYVYQKTGKAPVLIGLSMGTIIVNEFLRRTDIPIAKVIFDGYVASPKEWIERLAANGKTVTLPKDYRSRKYRLGKVESLFIISEKYFYSTLSDIPKGQPDRNIKTFDCEHISGFFRLPEEYTTGIVSFIDVSL